MFDFNYEELTNDHWVFPVHARTFHQDAGIRDKFSSWLHHRINGKNLEEDYQYCINKEWDEKTQAYRNEHYFELWAAYDLARKMSPESKSRALRHLAEVEAEAARRGWNVFKG